jgi:hypothetical protein
MATAMSDYRKLKWINEVENKIYISEKEKMPILISHCIYMKVATDSKPNRTILFSELSVSI